MEPIKEREILLKILALINEGKMVAFEDDWGGNTITICVDNAHTHCGSPDGSFQQMVDDLYLALVQDRGPSRTDCPTEAEYT
jgi:hypothetical protein